MENNQEAVPNWGELPRWARLSHKQFVMSSTPAACLDGVIFLCDNKDKIRSNKTDGE